MTNDYKTGSRFLVDLGSIKLPLLKEQQVNAEIQAVVLRALAQTDFSGEAQALQRLPNWAQFGDRTWGLWPIDESPVFPLSGDSGPLTVQDHTLIMRAVMEHPLQVLLYLPEKVKSKGGRPSGKQVLQAALQVAQIGDDVKQRVRTALALLPKLEEAQAAAPESLKYTVDDLLQTLANKTLEEMRGVLRSESLRGKYREHGIAERMEMAAQLLQEGEDSIYSPGYSFYKILQGDNGSSLAVAEDAVGRIAYEDTYGALFGGVLGCIFASTGAAGHELVK